VIGTGESIRLRKKYSAAIHLRSMRQGCRVFDKALLHLLKVLL
jgi:hypothetical protein